MKNYSTRKKYWSNFNTLQLNWVQIAQYSTVLSIFTVLLLLYVISILALHSQNIDFAVRISNRCACDLRLSGTFVVDTLLNLPTPFNRILKYLNQHIPRKRLQASSSCTDFHNAERKGFIPQLSLCTFGYYSILHDQHYNSKICERNSKSHSYINRPSIDGNYLRGISLT